MYLFGASAVVGCSVKEVPAGAQIVDRVDVIGAEKVDEDAMKERIATGKTEHALGGLLAAIPMLTYVDALTVEYRTFDRLVLDRDLERIRRWYRARGFYDAEVSAGRVVKTEEGHVRVEIVVNEGEPVLIEQAELSFPDWRRALRANAALVDIVARYQREPIEAPEVAPRFDEDRYDELKGRVRRALTDRGYAYAEVEGEVDVDVAKRQAQVRLVATAGPFCHLGEVTIEGLGEIPDGPVRRALGFRKGDAYSTEVLEQAHVALADFEVFGSVEIEARRSKKGEPPVTQIPVVVRVQPMRLRGVKVGLGGELGTRLDVHGVLGWEDRNFLGGMRRLSIEARPSLLFFPLQATTIFDPPPDILVIPQAEGDIHFKQPGFPEARTNTLVSAGAKFYRPRTLPDPVNFDADVDHVVVYRELNGSVGVERTWHFPYLGGFDFYGSPKVKLQFDSPAEFNLEGGPPEGFENVLIPYLELSSALDFRRNRAGKLDPNNPVIGAYLALNAQFAALGDAEDVRLRPEVRLYAPLGDDVVFAVRWTTGFLFPFGYGDSLLGDGTASEAERARDLQLLSLRAFYSGGPTSNRGYLFRDVGPHEVLAFLSQRGQGSDALLPSGGRGMWELSTELRFSLTESLLGVLFLDASDVVRSLSDFRFSHPHLSPGVGVRYVSQVGRIRLDLGVRPPYLQELGAAQLAPNEGGPEPGQSPGVPLAFHVAIGEAI